MTPESLAEKRAIRNREREIHEAESHAYNSKPIRMKPIEKNERMKENLAADKDERMRNLREGVGGIIKNPARLRQHEVLIESKVGSIKDLWFDIGEQLSKIRDEGDFPQATFEAYIEERWEGRSRSWAYKLIAGYKGKAGLPENAENFPQNPSQSRALAEAPPERRVEIITKVKSEGKVTAKAITKAIREPVEASFETDDRPSEEIRDCNNVIVPKRLHSEWNARLALTEDMKFHVNVIRGEYEKNTLLGKLPKEEKRALGDIYANLDFELCSKCVGEKCDDCDHVGIVSSSPWK